MPFVEIGDKRVLFIHIPRTGGTTIERWLETLGGIQFRTMGVPKLSRVTPQHYRADDIRALFAPSFFDYRFAIVRDPYTRLESEYKLQATLSQQGFWKGAFQFGPWLHDTLRRFAENPEIYDNHIRPQWQFIDSKMRIFKFEQGLTSIVETVCGELSLDPPASLGSEYSTSTFSGEITWEVTDILAVNRVYHDDFRLFGYERREPSIG